MSHLLTPPRTLAEFIDRAATERHYGRLARQAAEFLGLSPPDAPTAAQDLVDYARGVLEARGRLDCEAEAELLDAITYIMDMQDGVDRWREL